MGKIKAGTKNSILPHPSRRDELDPYVQSMAEAMENAFEEEWPIIMGTDKPKKSDHLQLMFIAIAQGVVKHLSDNVDSFIVDIPSVSGNGITVNTVEKKLKRIDSRGILY